MDNINNICPELIQQTWRVFGCAEGIEVRAICKAKIYSGIFTSPEDLITSISLLANEEGVQFYFVFNPLENPQKWAQYGQMLQGAQTIKNSDIVRRKWLFVDLDPIRPKGVSSTEKELTAAKVTAERIATRLGQLGFPRPLRAISGNGVHVFWRIDLPNDDETNQLISAFLRNISTEFGNSSIEIDQAVKNAARLTKLYGSRAQKGVATEERPHRMAVILDEGEDVILTKEIIEAYNIMYAPARDNNIYKSTIQQVGEDAGEDEQELEYSKNGSIKCTRKNVMILLRKNHIKIVKNLFLMRSQILGATPWDTSKAIRSIEEDEAASLRLMLESAGMAAVSSAIVEDAILCAAREHSYHPIRQYLTSVQWDGTERLDRALTHYLGAEDTPYTRAVCRKTLVAACRRVFYPGCKFDNVLTLVGDNGYGKSMFFSILGSEWFSDSLPPMSNWKAAKESLEGVWIMESGDLSGFSKGDAEAAKAFISAQNDSFRRAYGREKGTYPRQCVIVATTNRDTFLRSSYGNRRWWVVPVGVVPRDFHSTPAMLEQLKKDRDQLWAEAMTHLDTEELYLPEELEETARNLQAQANVATTDPMAVAITNLLSDKKIGDKVCYEEFAETEIAPHKGIVPSNFVEKRYVDLPNQTEVKKAFNRFMRTLEGEGWKKLGATTYKPYYLTPHKGVFQKIK